MSYRVYRFEVDKNIDQNALENFLNGLDGKVISVFPNIKPAFKGMGATASIDSLIIVIEV